MSQGYTKGTPIDTDATMSANSDLVTPSQAAVVTYVGNAVAGLGTVTNVTATAPLQSTGGATPNLSIPQASITQNGYLSAADFAAFSAGGFDQKKLMAYIAAY